ncbi:sigma-70 family RNA polymerase sigma factor [Pilimelia columellifera]|uniref:Sigma-70 family RNA polymerase sigma factor n=1 Tax=Pilimelia columellifera subsp. columellifera TaxID=706583 RepID=A0ABN3N849_9ACTN
MAPAQSPDNPERPPGPTPPQDEPELLAAVRAGHTSAYGKLYRRHLAAARRAALSLARDRAEADDLVAETFVRVLAALRRGHGPDRSLLPYLLTTLRHLRITRAGAEARLVLTDDLTRYEHGEPFQDPTVAALDRSYAARAFGKLPERWRTVLWHTEVRGERPTDIAEQLGLTPNGVSVLAHRARERLREIYLQEHLADAPRHEMARQLGSYVRGGLAHRERSKVATHLATCPACRRLHGELTEVACGLPRGVAEASQPNLRQDRYRGGDARRR